MLSFTVEVFTNDGMCEPDTHDFRNIAEARSFLYDIDFKQMFKDEANAQGSILCMKNRRYTAYLNAIDEMDETETLDMRTYDYANYTADTENDRH